MFQLIASTTSDLVNYYMIYDSDFTEMVGLPYSYSSSLNIYALYNGNFSQSLTWHAARAVALIRVYKRRALPLDTTLARYYLSLIDQGLPPRDRLTPIIPFPKLCDLIADDMRWIRNICPDLIDLPATECIINSIKCLQWTGLRNKQQRG